MRIFVFHGWLHVCLGVLWLAESAGMRGPQEIVVSLEYIPSWTWQISLKREHAK